MPPPKAFELPYLDGAFSCTEYTLNVSHAIHRFKFRNQPQLASLFGSLTAKRLGDDILLCQPDYLCGVAMHPKKQRKRGYNQANLFAEDLAKRLDIPYAELLKKNRSTPAQHTLSAAERKVNLAGAYTVPDPHKVKGKRILIVDDVITTGSTMAECAQVLLEAGAVWVGGLSFARPFDSDHH